MPLTAAARCKRAMLTLRRVVWGILRLTELASSRRTPSTDVVPPDLVTFLATAAVPATDRPTPNPCAGLRPC